MEIVEGGGFRAQFLSLHSLELSCLSRGLSKLSARLSYQSSFSKASQLSQYWSIYIIVAYGILKVTFGNPSTQLWIEWTWSYFKSALLWIPSTKTPLHAVKLANNMERTCFMCRKMQPTYRYYRRRFVF